MRTISPTASRGLGPAAATQVPDGAGSGCRGRSTRAGCASGGAHRGRSANPDTRGVVGCRALARRWRWRAASGRSKNDVESPGAKSCVEVIAELADAVVDDQGWMGILRPIRRGVEPKSSRTVRDSAWEAKSRPSTEPKVDDRLANLGWGRQQHRSKSVP